MAGHALVLGVDAGGTKTDALVADDAGDVLGFGAAGPANWEGVGLGGTREALEEAVGAALAAAGVARDQLDAAAFGLAGCDWPSDHDRLDAVLEDLGVPSPRLLLNDSFAALRAGTRRRFGCVSVAGTGGSTAGRNPAGHTFKTFAASWGEGSGASGLVTRALHAIAREHHGQTGPTALTPLFLAALDLDSVPHLFEGLTRGGLPRLGADLAPLVLDAARGGDAAAREIACGVGGDHGRDVVGVARRLGMLDAAFEVVRAGGVHAATDPSFDAAFASVVNGHAPQAELVLLATPAAAGAALLALELLGLDADAVHDDLAAAAARARDLGLAQAGDGRVPSRAEG